MSCIDENNVSLCVIPHEHTQYVNTYEAYFSAVTRRTEEEQDITKQRRGKQRERTLLIEKMLSYKSYDEIEDLGNRYGQVELIKQKPQNHDYVKCYIVYEDCSEVEKAIENEDEIKNKLGRQVTLTAVRVTGNDLKLGNKGPYIVNRRQKEREEMKIKRKEIKTKTIPKYFWAKFQRNKRNYIKARNWLYRKLGETSWKKYNGGILITAEVDQAHILKNIQLKNDDPFELLEPHRSFNTTWGAIFSWDLKDYTEEELLEVCPEYVLKVEKPMTEKPLFFLQFNRENLNISEIQIEQINIPIKPRKPLPMLCKRCYEYGHTKKWCRAPNERCFNCGISVELHDTDTCLNDTNCYHCNLPHNTTSKKCRKYIEEQNLLMTAEMEKIDLREARKRIP